MQVIELLEEITNIVDTSNTMPLTNKIMVDGNELKEIVTAISQSLPDDLQEAKWIRDEKERLLEQSKAEYMKLMEEAKKQADYIVTEAEKQAALMVEDHEITRRAQREAEELKKQAEQYANQLKVQTYDYLDNALYDMQGKFDELNGKYLNQLFNYMSTSFTDMGDVLQKNREELQQMKARTKNGEEWR